MHVTGVNGIGNGTAVCLTQEDSEQRLSIAMRLSKVPPKYLSYSQITSVGTAYEDEIVEQNKSVVGRAAVGGLVFGPLGAIVGGISGTGSKQKSQTRFFFIINYHSANNPGEIGVISFEIVGASLHSSKFIDALKTKIPQQPEQPSSQYL
nr:MAG TPA: hypothetical protein [Caudoviricetes sp.]